MRHAIARVLARRRPTRRDVVIEVDGSGFPEPSPFQFFMLSAPLDPSFPFLPRPFSVFDAVEGRLAFWIREVGAGTRALAAVPEGGLLRLVGPLGAEVVPPRGAWTAVAGGVGLAPFRLALRRRAEGRFGDPEADVTVLYGERDAGRLVEPEAIERLGARVEIVTEDGSAGRRGRVTDRFAECAASGDVAEAIACGPEPMMAAAARIAKAAGIAMRLSLETYMACGFGVCNACAVKVEDPRYREGYRYARCCVEGPVFPAERLDLEAL